VTRPRSSAPAPSRPARRRSLPWLLFPVLAAFLVVGCIGQEEVQDEPTPSPVASATVAAPSVEPTVEASLTPEATPTPTAEATPDEVATATPTTPASGDPPPSGAAGSADACSGNDDNRSFFSDAATAFDWPVYCAVLPARWFVADGQYRSARGGWLEIFYQGPGGARLELYEGGFCEDADGCVPDGPDAGTAAFGDQSGALVNAVDGRYAIVVDRGAALSWLAIGEGLDVETFKDLAADLVLVQE